MTAGGVMLLGITGLMVLLVGIRKSSADAAFNSLAAKEAQRLLNMRITGDLADTGPIGVNCCDNTAGADCIGAFAQIQMQYQCRIVVLDTSDNTPPVTPPNIGVPSRLVTVQIRRVQGSGSFLNSPTWHVQQGYALPPP